MKGGGPLNRLAVDALIPVAACALAAAACLGLFGGVPDAGLLAAALGAAAVLLTIRAHYVLLDFRTRFEGLRHTLWRALADDPSPNPPPAEGGDEIAQMGQIMAGAARRLTAAREEAAVLGLALAERDRRAGALVEFGSSTAGTEAPDAVWGALDRALRAGLGGAAAFRVLLREPGEAALHEAAAAGPRPEGSGWDLEKPLLVGGRIFGVVQVHAPGGGPGTHAFLDALAGYASLAWATAESLRRAREDAETDPLSGLRNRRWLERSAGEELERSRRLRRTFSLAIVDIDRLGALGDQYGHPAADTALRAAATAIRAAARPGDGVARLGGGQFAVLLPDTPLDLARTVAERVRLGVAGTHVAHAGRPLPLSVSVGCAAWPQDDTGWEVVLAAADAALHEARRAGRNRVEVAAGPW